MPCRRIPAAPRAACTAVRPRFGAGAELRLAQAARAAGLALAGGMLALPAWQPAAHAQAMPAAAPSPQPADQARRYDIPAGPLGSALARFAAESGVLLAGSAGLVQGRNSPGASGTLGTRATLDALLSGTGLRAVRQPNGSYVLDRAAAAGPSAPAPGSGAQAGSATMLSAISVVAAAPDGALPPAYAGGQVARGGRVGLLGNRDVMDTPFNQTSYTSRLIEDQQAKSLADVLANDPSVATDSPPGGGWEGAVMRGFRQSDGTGTFSLNGLFAILPEYVSAVNWAERVEVLKGPSALVNGMPTGNAIGGTVNYVSKRAQDEPNASLTASYTSRSQFGVAADVGRRFGESKEFGIRFNGEYRDGGLPTRPGEEKLASGVLGLDWRGERVRLSADLGRQVQEVDSANRPLGVIDGISVPEPPSNRKRFLPSWTYWHNASTFGMAQGEIDLARNVTAYAAAGMRESERRTLFINPTVQNDAGDWVSTPQHAHGRTRAYSGLAGLRATLETGPVLHALALNAARVREIGYTSQMGGSPVSSNLYDPVDIPAPDIPLGDPHRTSVADRSSFGIADTLSVLDERVQLTLGVRRQQVVARGYNLTTGLQTSHYKSSAWSPGVALVLRPRENVSLYANYVQGLQPGTIVGDNYVNAGQVFSPYKSKQYEAGIKVDWSQRLMTSISVFQIKQPSGMAIPGAPLPTYALDGEQRNRGVEVNVYGEPVPGVRLTGGFMAIDARLSKTAGGANDGNRATGVPALQATLGAEWDLPFAPGLTLTGRVRHGGRTWGDPENTQNVASWTQLDLGARYTLDAPWNHKPVILRLGVNNVFDRNYWINRSVGSLHQSLPRTVMLSATVNF